MPEFPVIEPVDDDEAAMKRECEQMAARAAGGRCIYGESVFFRPWRRALLPGHIYSNDGRAEFGISGCCEYHFDHLFGDDD